MRFLSLSCHFSKTADQSSTYDAVRRQYERFPYPPVSRVAMPRRIQGQGLRYENGMQRLGQSNGPHRTHQGIRILVAGGGTLEPLVVAQRHPAAKEIVAVDCSATSISRLMTRLAVADGRAALMRPLRRGYRVPLRLVRADLRDWEDGRFDYIIATNVVHHLPDPARMLARLASWLAPGGLLRLVTYPYHSRYWVRCAAQWLKLCGLDAQTARLRPACHRAMEKLPTGHPVRSSFRASRERDHRASLVDAYFHACENPLSPLAWQRACTRSGLRLIGEGQDPWSCSSVLDRLVPALQPLGAWEKLQILDDLLELAANPVLWLVKEASIPADEVSPVAPRGVNSACASRLAGDLAEFGENARVLAIGGAADLVVNEVYRLPSQTYFDFRRGIERARDLLDTVNVDVHDVTEAFRAEFGPRSCRDGSDLLPGLTLGEYEQSGLFSAFEPWDDRQWAQQVPRLGTGVRLVAEDGRGTLGGDLVHQAQWLQAVFGPMSPFIPVRVIAI